jgi:NADH-quinone oxidoreductase subunit L
MEYGLMAGSTLVAALGVGLAWALYNGGTSDKAPQIAKASGPIYGLLLNKYWVDELYFAAIIKPLRAVSQLLFQLVDRFLVDALMVRGPGLILLGLSNVGRVVQNGEVQAYLVGLIVGVAALAWYFI